MVKKLLLAGVALAMATTAFAASSDYYENNQVTEPYTWDGAQPASILLIQDQPGWGFDSHVQILISCGIPYDIINSAQIGATDFSGYDKIVTTGQQPDNYYTAIDTNSAKFEDFMNAGNCISFETANYFGGMNEFITWPGGFTAVINQGANQITIDNADNCVLNGVTLGELQGWNYSAHGIHQNLPAGYVSYLSTVDGFPPGSCMGFFPWGAGGAYISHQPLEWAYGFGYTTTFPRNFDCCECGVPVATEPTTWGNVKALFR
jgi:hypothetical protein